MKLILSLAITQLFYLLLCKLTLPEEGEEGARARRAEEPADEVVGEEGEVMGESSSLTDDREGRIGKCLNLLEQCCALVCRNDKRGSQKWTVLFVAFLLDLRYAVLSEALEWWITDGQLAIR